MKRIEKRVCKRRSEPHDARFADNGKGFSKTRILHVIPESWPSQNRLISDVIVQATTPFPVD